MTDRNLQILATQVASLIRATPTALAAIKWLRSSGAYDADIWLTLPDQPTPNKVFGEDVKRDHRTLLAELDDNSMLDALLPILRQDLSQDQLDQAIQLIAPNGAPLLKSMLSHSEIRSPQALPGCIRASTTDALTSMDHLYEVRRPGAGLLAAVMKLVSASLFPQPGPILVSGVLRQSAMSEQELAARAAAKDDLVSALREANHRLKQTAPDPQLWLQVSRSSDVHFLKSLGADLNDIVDAHGQRMPAWRALLNKHGSVAFESITGQSLPELDPAGFERIQRFACSEITECNKKETAAYIYRFEKSAAQTPEGGSKLVIAINARPDLIPKLLQSVVPKTPASTLGDWLAPDDNGLTPLAYAMASKGANALGHVGFEAVARLFKAADQALSFSSPAKPWWQIKLDRSYALARRSGQRAGAGDSLAHNFAQDDVIVRARLVSEDPIALLFGPKDQQQPLIDAMDRLLSLANGPLRQPSTENRAATEMVWMLGHLTDRECDGLHPDLLDRMRFAAVCMFSAPPSGNRPAVSPAAPIETLLIQNAHPNAPMLVMLNAQARSDRFCEPPKNWTSDMLEMLAKITTVDKISYSMSKQDLANWHVAAEAFVLSQASTSAPSTRKSKM